MKLQDFLGKANFYGVRHTPFLFLIDFELKNPFLYTFDEAAQHTSLFQVNDIKNYKEKVFANDQPKFDIFPITYKEYLNAFDLVMKNILAGNTYLINLTFPTTIKTNYSLLELFHLAQAPYKFYFKDKFIVFSPESFVKTQKNYIFSYPMKGTIDADIPNASKIILENKKEEWEHNTIVDLIRNDLAMVSKNITVTRFRFITEIHTNRKNLLQVSSEIRGELPENWRNNIGEILIKLLPAGSISGAPKQKTVEIIIQAEKIKRDYFTGIFGIFDGNNIDSAVNIRFIEKTQKGLQFRSGGGITSNSNPVHEYAEMLDKVYVPIG